jgi:DNA replication protein DnaC
VAKIITINQKNEEYYMLNTINQLHQLRLGGMAQALNEQLEQPPLQDLSFEERLAFLVDREVLHRSNRRLANLLKQAKLRQNALAENVDYAHQRNLNKSQFASLCRNGYSVRYVSIPRFLEELTIARADGSYGRFLNQVLKLNLLILDDFGFAPGLTTDQRRDFFNLIEDRHQMMSTIITSQLPIKHWHEYIGEPTIADAILDRLLQNAHRIELKGGSMRKKIDKNDKILASS